MKKLILLACILLMAGCTAKRPATAVLNPAVTKQPAGVYTSSRAVIRGEDARKFSEVIEYRLGEPPFVRVPTLTPANEVITSRLAEAFQEQGLVLSNDSEARIIVELKKLLVTVTQDKLLYTSTTTTNITLKITSGQKTLTKKYDRQSANESVTRPTVGKLEIMLNDQLTNIIERILEDDEVKTILTMI